MDDSSEEQRLNSDMDKTEETALCNTSSEVIPVSDEMLESSKSVREKNDNFPKEKKNETVLIAALLVAIVTILCICVQFFDRAVNDGFEAAKKKYNNDVENACEKEKDNYKKKGKEDGFNEYKTINEASISVEGLREEALLEVLEVTDVVYDISTEEETQEGITAWLEIPGKGVFTVDMKACEFIIDEERKYVLVRVPRPELTQSTIVYSEVKRLLFKNNVFNDSTGVGEETARKALKNADALIKKSFASNVMFYQSAEHSAKVIIINLVKSLNPDLTDLTVEVEFIK